MSIKEFLKPTNKSMFYWFILGMAILIAGGAIWYYSNSIQEPTEKKQATYPLDIVLTCPF